MELGTPRLDDLVKADCTVEGVFKAKRWVWPCTENNCDSMPAFLKLIEFLSAETADGCKVEVEIVWPEYDCPESIDRLGEADSIFKNTGYSVP